MRGYGMDIVHFTPGSLNADSVRRADAAAILPLATGKGNLEISGLYLPAGGRISVPPTGHSQMIMTVNGKALATFPTGFGPEIYAGMGMLLHPGETCELQS